MDLPNLKWINVLASTDSFSKEDYEKFIRSACCHFLELIPSVEFADMRFETELRGHEGLHSGIVHNESCSTKHQEVKKMAINYGGMLNSIPYALQKVIGIGTCVEEITDIRALLINVNLKSKENIDGVYQGKSSSNYCKSCSIKGPIDIYFECEPVKKGYHATPPLKAIINGNINSFTHKCSCDLIDSLSEESSDILKNSIDAFSSATNGLGSLIYIPLRAHYDFHRSNMIHGGMYLYNLTGNKIEIDGTLLNYCESIVYLIGTNERVQLYSQEIKYTLANVSVADWTELKKYGLELNPNPHHWYCGGLNLVSAESKEDARHKINRAADKYKVLSKKYIPDIDDFELWEWTAWHKPPLRAIAQNHYSGRDLSTFMHLLEQYLSVEYDSLQISFKSCLPKLLTEHHKEYHLDSLWFNAVALGRALDAICSGLDSMREGSTQLVSENSKAKVIVEYDCEFISNDILIFFITLYEYFLPKQKTIDIEKIKPNSSNPSQFEFKDIPYKSRCWQNSKHSLKDARKYLYTCGVRTLIYSGGRTNDQSNTFASELINFQDSDKSTSTDINISSYKTYPPFAFFGLPAFYDEYSNIKLISEEHQLHDLQAGMESLFRRIYASNSN